MKMKSIVAILIAALFLLGLESASFAWGKTTVKGTVTNIEDNKVTVKDAKGNEKIVDVKDVKDTKVGDKVVIKNGVVKKMTEKHKKTEKSESPKKQAIDAQRSQNLIPEFYARWNERRTKS